VARRNKSGDYSYTRTAKIRGREQEGRFAVIRKDSEQARVARRRSDGTAEGDGELVQSADLRDIKPPQIVLTAQRGTITLPGEMRRDLGIEEGTPLQIIQEADGRLTIEPLKRTSASLTVDLADLLLGITPENIHGEIDFGDSVGREVW